MQKVTTVSKGLKSKILMAWRLYCKFSCINCSATMLGFFACRSCMFETRTKKRSWTLFGWHPTWYASWNRNWSNQAKGYVSQTVNDFQASYQSRDGHKNIVFIHYLMRLQGHFVKARTDLEIWNWWSLAHQCTRRTTPLTQLVPIMGIKPNFMHHNCLVGGSFWVLMIILCTPVQQKSNLGSLIWNI